MGKLAVTEFLTLDGVMDSPHEWSFPYWTEEMGSYKLGELEATDALLLGRVTYEGFAEAWPDRTDEAGFADRMNTLPKYVVSTTLEDPAWQNSEVIEGDVTEAVVKLKEETGGDIVIHGSATLVQSLMPHGLIDEYRLLVYPLILGGGKRLFPDGIPRQTLQLTRTQGFTSGAILQVYTPAPEPGRAA